MSMTNAFEILDTAAVLLEQTKARFENFDKADRERRVVALIKTRMEQAGLDDAFFYDESTQNLASIVYEDPVRAATAMIEMSEMTNMASFDSVYPEEARADELSKELAAGLRRQSDVGGGSSAPLSSAGSALSSAGGAGGSGLPARAAIDKTLRADCEKVMGVHGFSVFARELVSQDRAAKAFTWLATHGLGIYVRDQTWFTTDKKKDLWSADFITEIKGPKGYIFLKVPHEHLSSMELSTAMTKAQIPLSTRLTDPRLPLASTLGRDTKFKQSGYLRWLLTGLEEHKKLSLLDETGSGKNESLLELAKVLQDISNESVLLKGEDETVLEALVKLNAPKDNGEAGSTVVGSSIDMLHRVLFNLFLSKQTTDEEIMPKLKPAQCPVAL